MKKLFNLTKLILPFLFIVFSCFFIGCDPTPVPAEHEHNFSKNGDCYGCDATVTFDKGLMYFLVDDYYEVSYDKYSDYKELTIPSSFNGIPVKKIPAEAFYNCNITSIVFEDGLTEIGSLAFSNTKITRLDLPDSLISIDNNAIDGCLELSSISIGKN